MKPINFLLVEENRRDEDLTPNTLEAGKLRNKSRVVRGGKGMSLLLHGCKNAGTPRPGLLLPPNGAKR
jgi:hypothetical protein